MIRRYYPLALLLILAFAGLAHSETVRAVGPSAGKARDVGVSATSANGEFKELSIIFELNETDDDAEVVMVVKAFTGMEQLNVIDPTGRTIIAIETMDRDGVGQQQLRIESAEPSPDDVRASFPEGLYRFEAHTVAGDVLEGAATLTHAIVPAPTFSPSEIEVDPRHATVRWSPVPGVAAYLIEIEQDDLGVNLAVTLTPDASSFEVPAGFLLPGMEYDLGLSAVTTDGNVTVAESSFSTEADGDDDDDDDDFYHTDGDDDDDDDD